MKTSIRSLFIALTLLGSSATVFAQTTTFTYQGQLTDNGLQASGVYDLEFNLFAASSGGSPLTSAQTVNDLSITNGLFTVTLEFGAAPFDGSDRFLQIGVRPGASAGAYTNLVPRQKLTSTPYAIRALNAANLVGIVPNGGLAGTYSGALMFSNAGSSFSGTFNGTHTGNGAALTNLNANNLASGTLLDARLSGNVARTNQVWLLGGNAGTTPGTHFLGTTDNQALEFKANNQRLLRLEPNAASPNILAGFSENIVSNGVVGATISGGGDAGQLNRVIDDYGTVGGGSGNVAGSFSDNSTSGARFATVGGGNQNGAKAHAATVSGGELNSASGNNATVGGGYNNSAVALGGTVGGGSANLIETNAQQSTISGGIGNRIRKDADHATIAGGEFNDIGTNSSYSAIGGGTNNTIVANSAYATIPGGDRNTATNRAFAAGTRAKANHTGAFVWGDGTIANIASTNANSVTFRAAGGYRLFSNSGATLGVFLAAGGGSWTGISDRNAKENFAPVDARAVLEKVAALPLSHWNYKSQPEAIRHIGPMAQDFKAAFAVGESDTGITTIDADGVALAAIQGLNQKLEDQLAAQKAELNTKDNRIIELEQRLSALERIIKPQTGKGK